MPVQPGDLISYVHLMGIIEELPQYGLIDGFLWQDLFPPDQSPSPHLAWKLAHSQGNLAGFISIRGVAKTVDKLGEDREFADVTPIGASWRVDPLVVQEAMDAGAFDLINNPESIAGRALVAKIEDEMVGGATECIRMMDRQREYMAIQALTTGGIVWPPLDENGQVIAAPMAHWNPEMEINFTYTMEAQFVQQATTLLGWQNEPGGHIPWDQPGATIIKDLRIIRRLMKKLKGLDAKGGRIITDGITIDTLAESDEIRSLVYGKDNLQQGARDFADMDALVRYLKTKLGWTLEEYMGEPWTYVTYSNGKATVHSVDFWPQGTMVFIPRGVTPGNMMETPHETQEGNFDYGNIPWYKRDDEPPYARRGGVRAVAWPTFPHSKEIFIFRPFA